MPEAKLIKIAAWVTEAEAEMIYAAAKAEARSVSNFARLVLLERVTAEQTAAA